MSGRLPRLDATRGVLCLVVVGSHLLRALGIEWLFWPAQGAVLVFFAMSGYVLMRAYDGRPLAFLLRRFVRLWPLYALGLAMGHAARGTAPGAGEFVWMPMLPFGQFPPADPPAWSLYYEAWATPLMPALFWVARRSGAVAMAIALASIVLISLDMRFCYAPFFALGIAAAGTATIGAGAAPAPLLWLGKISYSLYLTHVPVLLASLALLGRAGVPASVPVMAVAAWLAWRWVERPSILWSRALARAAPARTAVGNSR